MTRWTSGGVNAASARARTASTSADTDEAITPRGRWSCISTIVQVTRSRSRYLSVRPAGTRPPARPPAPRLGCRQRRPKPRARCTTSRPQKARFGAHTFAGFPSGYLREVVFHVSGRPTETCSSVAEKLRSESGHRRSEGLDDHHPRCWRVTALVDQCVHHSVDPPRQGHPQEYGELVANPGPAGRAQQR